MCGIAGFLSLQNTLTAEQHGPVLQRMAAMMQTRGPDDEGVWVDPQGRAGFAFRRLSILDLSIAGHQPMHSPGERSVILLNGEIYNFQTLRNMLEGYGHVFHTHTDTEVLLAALETWGLEDTLGQINGMFAFAWYDRREKTLILARDHAGIKPLYYAIDPHHGGVSFASQFNVLLKGPWNLPADVDQKALSLYLQLHHIPPPHALLKNTHQLGPGQYLQVNQAGEMKLATWWSLPRHKESGFIPVEDAIKALDQRLYESVERQRIADVPVGVFLSGGIDSPLVASYARQQVGTDLKAFTISVPGWGQDESEAARRYARHLGLDHHVIELSGDDMLAAVDAVIAAQHEPFADYSIIPTYLVCKHSRQEIKVALSGDGGDELFFGYQRPFSLLRDGEAFRWPHLVRLALYGAGKSGLIPKKSGAIISRNPGEYYFGVNSRFYGKSLAKLAPDLAETGLDLYHFEVYQGKLDLANYSRYVEFYGQLQRCLKKVDMASAQVSFEVRVPLLDRNIVDLSLKINPFDMMRGKENKWVLRQLLQKYIPSDSITTTKRGFGVPLGEWLRGPLKAKVEETLFDRGLYPTGFFNRDALLDYWQEHLSSQRDHKWGLWTILSLQWWAMRNLESD